MVDSKDTGSVVSLVGKKVFLKVCMWVYHLVGMSADSREVELVEEMAYTLAEQMAGKMAGLMVDLMVDSKVGLWAGKTVKMTADWTVDTKAKIQVVVMVHPTVA